MEKRKRTCCWAQRWVVTFVAMFCAQNGSALAQETSATLRAAHDASDASRVTITLEVDGKLRQEVQIASGGELASNATTGDSSKQETMEFPLRVAGRLMYDEVLRRVPGPAFSEQSARFYHHAEANIQVGKHADRINLRENRRLVSVKTDARVAEAGLLYSLAGPLTREELDLVEVPGNSLVVDRLLPNREIRVGEKWTQDSRVVAKLVNCDDVADGEVTCQLTQVTNGLAIVSLSGSAKGTTDSAETTVQFQGEFRYDIHWGRITWLQLDTREDRQSGLVQPGFDVASELRMRVEPLKQSQSIGADIVKSAWGSNPESHSLLALEPCSSDFELVHDRRWHMTGDFPRQTVLRCLNKGELLAQLNVSELAKLPKGRELSLEEFQKDIQTALGNRFREFVSATKDELNGHPVLRIVAAGVVDDVPIHWIYYHVNDVASGRRAAHVYILESENLEVFEGVDREMLAGFQFRPSSNAANNDPAVTVTQPNATPTTPASRSVRLNNGEQRSKPVR